MFPDDFPSDSRLSRYCGKTVWLDSQLYSNLKNESLLFDVTRCLIWISHNQEKQIKLDATPFVFHYHKYYRHFYYCKWFFLVIIFVESIGDNDYRVCSARRARLSECEWLLSLSPRVRPRHASSLFRFTFPRSPSFIFFFHSFSFPYTNKSEEMKIFV